jgi:hypothetical protein
MMNYVCVVVFWNSHELIVVFNMGMTTMCGLVWGGLRALEIHRPTTNTLSTVFRKVFLQLNDSECEDWQLKMWYSSLFQGSLPALSGGLALLFFAKVLMSLSLSFLLSHSLSFSLILSLSLSLSLSLFHSLFLYTFIRSYFGSFLCWLFMAISSIFMALLILCYVQILSQFGRENRGACILLPLRLHLVSPNISLLIGSFTQHVSL